MSVGHYENFPVASVLLPARLRRPVAVDLPLRAHGRRLRRRRRPAASRAARAARSLSRRAAPPRGRTNPRKPLSSKLGRRRPRIRPAVAAVSRPARRVLPGRGQEALRRLRRGAGLLPPLGRPGRPAAAAPVRRRRRRRTCCSPTRSARRCSSSTSGRTSRSTSRKNRIYLPQDEMARFGVSEAQIAAADAGGRWPELMRFQVGARARDAAIRRAARARLPGRIGLEIRIIVQGGLRILEKIDARARRRVPAPAGAAAPGTGRCCCPRAGMRSRATIPASMNLADRQVHRP